jgi:hypothetical protein
MSSTVETLIQGGIKPRHLAALLKCSRVSASGWLRNRHEAQGMYAEKLEKLARRVSDALADNTLPIPADVSRKDEVSYLVRVLRKRTEG